jgi:hypothetical protein
MSERSERDEKIKRLVAFLYRMEKADSPNTNLWGDRGAEATIELLKLLYVKHRRYIKNDMKRKGPIRTDSNGDLTWSEIDDH